MLAVSCLPLNHTFEESRWFCSVEVSVTMSVKRWRLKELLWLHRWAVNQKQQAKQSKAEWREVFSCIQVHCPSFCSWSLVLKSEIMLILRPVHLNMSMQARNPPISMLLLMLVLVILLKCACESQNDLMFRHFRQYSISQNCFFFSKSSYGCKVWNTFWNCLTLSSDASSLSSRELSLQDGYSCTP